MRISTDNLKAQLDNWTVGANMMVGDMYTFWMVTGEVFQFSSMQYPVLVEAPGGRALCLGSSPGTTQLTLTGSNNPFNLWLKSGQWITDLNYPGVLAPGTYVTDWSPGPPVIITLSQPVQPGIGVQLNDWLSFGYYYSLGPRFSRTKIKTQIGPQVDELSVDMLVGADDYITLGNSSNMTWQDAIYHGLFDGGYLQLDRAFFSTYPGDPSPYGTCQGSITWFYGRLSDITVGRTKIGIKVKSLLDVLTIQMPRRLFQASCTWVFGAPGCDYDRINGKNADGTSTGIGSVNITCTDGSSQSMINFDSGSWSPNPSDVYDNGTIISTNGQNNGYVRTIGTVQGGSIYFLKPWIFPVTPGSDTFELLPGCNHTQDRCGDFSNSDRFGGFPYIPPPETAI